MAEAQADQDGEAGSEGDVASADGDVVAATLAYLARALVEYPDDVRVDSEPDDRGAVYHLHVHPDDMGRVIGRAGRIARAIRTVARAAAAREGTSVRIEIGDA